MILDRSYNYRANNLCQKVAPIDIYVKTTTKTKEKQRRRQQQQQQQTHLFTVNKHSYIYTFVSVSILIISFTWSESEKEDNTILIYDTVSFQGASEDEKNVANNVVSHICPDR